jgi:hypothetical protein
MQTTSKHPGAQWDEIESSIRANPALDRDEGNSQLHTTLHRTAPTKESHVFALFRSLVIRVIYIYAYDEGTRGESHR